MALTQAASSLPSCSSSHSSHMSAKSAFASGSKEKEATPFASDSKEAILTSLGILTHLCDHSDHCLQISYKKYKAHLEACNTYDQYCSQVSNHPLMVEWLENGADKPSDLDVWGILLDFELSSVIVNSL